MSWLLAILSAGGAAGAINVGNRVWTDADGDGIQDAGETGFAGVTVQLWNASKTSLLSQDETDANGTYTVVAPSAGSYRVRVVLPPTALDFSPKDAGASDTTDSDVNPDGLDRGFTDVIVLAANVISITSIDAGLIPDPMGTNNVGDRVFRANASGTQTSTSGLSGVTVELQNLAGTVLQTTVSNSSGDYSFLAPAGTYRMRFVAPASYVPSPLPDAGGDDANDSDIDAAGYTAAFVVPASGKVRTLDAGFVFLANVGNLVWSDLDADGVQDAGEPGIEGVTVQLWNDTKTMLLDSDVTDANELYTVQAAAGASYRVRAVKKYLGDAFTLKNTGADDLKDSDVNPAGADAGFTDTIPIAINVISITSVDVGIIEDRMRDHTIGDTVFRADAAGLQAGGTVSGVPVALLDASGTVLQTTVSGSGGFYSFLVPPGTYRLRFGPYPGMIPSPHPNAGIDDTADSDIDDAGQTALFVLGAGQVRRDLDAGFVQLINIGNFCWHDTDEDGVQDPGEEGVPGVVLELWTADKATRLDTTVTKPGGIYTLRAPGPGDYRVWALRPSPLDTFSPKDAGGDNLTDSDVNTTSDDFGFTDPFTLASNVISTVIHDVGLIYSGPTVRTFSPIRLTAIRPNGATWLIDYNLQIFGSYQMESSANLVDWSPEGSSFSVVLATGTRSAPRSLLIPQRYFRIRRTR